MESSYQEEEMSGMHNLNNSGGVYVGEENVEVSQLQVAHDSILFFLREKRKNIIDRPPNGRH